MSKLESFGDATPVRMDFEDPKLQETFGGDEEEFENNYHEQLTAWKEAKQEYKLAKAEYEATLARYYKDTSEKSSVGRMTQSLGEWWNGQPEELVAQEATFKAARSAYAEGLQSVLAARGEQHETNAEFDETAQQAKEAFANRFILEPKADALELQKEYLHSPETVEKAEKLMRVLAKHKWTIRIGAVTLTGIAVGSGAGVLAGLGAAGAKAARIAAGATGGVLGAKYGDKIGTRNAEAAQADLSEAEAAAVDQFSVADIDKLETALTDAEQTVDSAERKRKYAIIAGALAGGITAANFDHILGVGTAEASVPDADEIQYDTEGNLIIPPEHMRSNAMIENPHLMAMLDRNIEAAAAGTETTTVELSQTATTEEVAAGPDPEAEAIAAEAMQVLQETDPENQALAAEAMEVLRETAPIPEHNVVRGDTLWAITKASYAAQLEGLTEQQVNQVLDGTFDALRQNPSLVSELGVTSGNIDLIYADQDVLEMGAIRDLVTANIERYGGGSVELEPGQIAVESGDTLSELTKEAFAAELSDLSSTQQSAVINGVMNEIRGNNALVAEIGVNSGDIDLITENDRLTLSHLQPIVEQEVERVLSAPEVTVSETVNETGTERVTTEVTTGEPEAETGTVTETREAPAVSVEAAVNSTGPLAPRALEVFGTQEAFIDAKLRFIESITTHEQNYLQVDGPIERVYAKVQVVSLDLLDQIGMNEIEDLEPANMREFLLKIGMAPTEYNMTNLERWFDFYRETSDPQRLAQLGIIRTPGMSLNDLVNEYLIATNR